MKKLKVLNLYAGIGGNRKLWPNNKIEVTAVENNKEIAAAYKKFFPSDKIIIGDAHKYLVDYYKEFDFIWSSPPCPTHSRIRKMNEEQNKPIYPDMKLYEEILFLQGYCNTKWVVENVMSWYNPLIKPYVSGKHYFWSNFIIPNFSTSGREHNSILSVLQKRKGFDITGLSFGNVEKKKVLRNCVESDLGLHVFNSAFKEKQITLL